ANLERGGVVSRTNTAPSPQSNAPKKAHQGPRLLKVGQGSGNELVFMQNYSEVFKAGGSL
ncbi:MAG: hypothetical protein SVX28_11150, partial [Pseudomonadota bacterium]|nr:hypothetical protein [Pseudomonadota bacterium]